MGCNTHGWNGYSSQVNYLIIDIHIHKSNLHEMHLEKGSFIGIIWKLLFSEKKLLSVRNDYYKRQIKYRFLLNGLLQVLKLLVSFESWPFSLLQVCQGYDYLSRNPVL